MKKTYKYKKQLIITGAALAAASTVYFYYNTFNKATKVDNITTSNNNETRPGKTDTAVDNQSSQTSPESKKVEKGGITIIEPTAGTQIEPGATKVRGTVTSSTGGDLYYTIKGANSGVLVDTKVQTITAGTNIEYSFVVNLDRLPKGSDSAALEVYLMNGDTRYGYADISIEI